MRDRKKIIIIMVSIIIIIAIIFLIHKKNTINFYLNGEDKIVVRFGSKFIDPGAVAKDGFGNDVTEAIKTYGEVNTNILGTYRIVYEIDYHGRKTLERTIVVENIPIEDLEIKLNGDEVLYILKDNPYNEEGAYIYNKVDNLVLYNEVLSITSDLDTSTVGEYFVNYTLNHVSGTISANRKIVIYDIDSYITPEELTTDKVIINLDFSKINNYREVRLPDGTIVSNRIIDYEVEENDEYKFIIYLNDNKIFTKVINIDNIIDNYQCNGDVTTIGTKLMVTPTNNIKEYKWNLDNNTYSGSNIFNKNKTIKNATVELVFDDDKTYTVNCNITDKLLYHFKYDINNTKPFMRSNTYTPSDKARLDAILKQVVQEAGYGTRAGVVAAARFLVGGLDYKVPYQGASYYRRVGLNIGQTGAWGSSGIGLDCYSFVVWARMQNGLPDNSFYSGTKYSTAKEVNNIRVGDYLLTPCSGECKNPYNINHIGLVIGVDDNYIYVAEEKTVNVNALVVTRLDKKNLPTKYSLSLVRHVDYPSEGNVTNMWME